MRRSNRGIGRVKLEQKTGQNVTLNTSGVLEPTTEDAADPPSSSSSSDPAVLRITSHKAPIVVGLSCQLAHRARSLKPVLLGAELRRKAPLDIALARAPRLLVWFDSQARAGDALDPAVAAGAGAREVDFGALGSGARAHQINFVPPPVPRVASGIWTEGALLQA